MYQSSHCLLVENEKGLILCFLYPRSDREYYQFLYVTCIQDQNCDPELSMENSVLANRKLSLVYTNIASQHIGMHKQ
jgi:hypothetical protein